jgi:hypothetical protein
MHQQHQIKGTLLDIENKVDKNQNPYFRLSLFKVPARYFYAFKNNLSSQIWQDLLEKPHNLVNQLVLITYEELANPGYAGALYKITALELI